MQARTRSLTNHRRKWNQTSLFIPLNQQRRLKTCPHWTQKFAELETVALQLAQNIVWLRENLSKRLCLPCWVSPHYTLQTVIKEWKIILRWWKWFCRGENDFAVAKMILPWRKWFCRDSCGPPYFIICEWWLFWIGARLSGFAGKNLRNFHCLR